MQDKEILDNTSLIFLIFFPRDADPNCEGPEDRTPLHCSAGQGNRMVTKLLLEYGANVRAKDILL